ncbi:MAG: class II aldolase/adducin family protein [Campylobacterota bacterium]|nr:class II aldolase/adducin family protein [Campylobacterota bacterium]
MKNLWCEEEFKSFSSDLDLRVYTYEAILHAIIPFKYVDHTRANAVVTLSNNVNGMEHIQNVFQDHLIVPYIMPGFNLAKLIYEMSKELDWENCPGIILLNHGIFTFDNDAKKSYDKMIEAVSKAEEYLQQHANVIVEKYMPRAMLDTYSLQNIINEAKGYDVFMKINQSPLALHYASQRGVAKLATRGVLTPEHIIRTKRVPMVLEDAYIQKAIDKYKEQYLEYFNEFSSDEICLNPSPNWVVVKNFGIVTFGKDEKEANIINDIVEHTMKAVLAGDLLGGYESIGLKESFEMEYWELEQAKLKK